MLAIIAAIENDFEREFITQIYLTYYKKMRAKAFFIIHDEGGADHVFDLAFQKLLSQSQYIRYYCNKNTVNLQVQHGFEFIIS